jgi:CTP synthase
MIEVCKYARENKIPYLGICLGMQIAVIEFCRNMLNYPQATSKEFQEDSNYDVITTMDDVSYKQLGGTLRLGSKKTIINDKESLAYKIYGKEVITERHRHRYEVNPKYIEEIEEKGMIFSGRDCDKTRMNFLEISGHPFFFACQSHPEFITNPLSPSPIFLSFILCASKQYNKFNEYKKTRKIGLEFVDFENFTKSKFNSKKENNGIFINEINSLIDDSLLIFESLNIK